MPTDDFFHARLDQMIDLHHPLAVLANRLPWPQIEAALAPAFERKNRQGQEVEINNRLQAGCIDHRNDSVDGLLAVSETRIQSE